MPTLFSVAWRSPLNAWRLEYATSSWAIQKCPGALAKILADFIRIRVGDPSGSVREHTDLVDHTRRPAARLPAGAALRRAGHECVRDCGSLIVVQAVEEGTDERPQLRSGHRLEGSVEIRV